MKRRTAFLSAATVMAVMALAACDSATAPDDSLFMPGVFAAESTPEGTHGAIAFVTEDSGGQAIDWIARGASIVISLRADGTTTGRLYIPDLPPEYLEEGDPPDFDEDLAGTWTLHGDTVSFSHEADTFLRDMPFLIQGDRLEGDETWRDRIRVILARVDS